MAVPFRIPKSYTQLGWDRVIDRDPDLEETEEYVRWLAKEMTTAKAHARAIRRQTKRKTAKPAPEPAAK